MGLRMNLFFECLHLAPRQLHAFSGRDVKDSRTLIIIEHSMFVAIRPLPHSRLGLVYIFYGNIVPCAVALPSTVLDMSLPSPLLPLPTHLATPVGTLL